MKLSARDASAYFANPDQSAAGLLIFGTFPDGWSWAGIAVIIGAGLYVWHRERVRGEAH